MLIPKIGRSPESGRIRMDLGSELKFENRLKQGNLYVTRISQL